MHACHVWKVWSARLGGDVAQLVEHGTGVLPTQVQFPGATRDFSSKVNFQCRLSYGVRTCPCAVAYIYICVHSKDPVVCSPCQSSAIMETLRHPACTIGWVAWLCLSWLSLGKATRISHRRNSFGTIQLFKKKRKCKVQCGSSISIMLLWGKNESKVVQQAAQYSAGFDFMSLAL